MRIQGSEEKIGELDEEFVFERNLGDRFTLGNRVWQIDQIDNQKVLVSPTRRSSMITPFWKADSLGMDSYFSGKVNCLLETINSALQKDETPAFSSETLPDAESGRELLLWLQNQRRLGDLPHRRHILIEQLTDPAITPDTIHFIVHTNWGASVNATCMFCLQAKFKEREGSTLQALYTDEAVVFSLPLEYDGFDILQDIHAHELPALLGKQLAGTGLFGSRFRMNAARALLVLRKGFNMRTPLWLQRMKSLELLEKVLTFRDFPIVQETWRELLEQELSIRQLQQYLNEIDDQSITITCIQTRTPSPFAADILWQLNNEYLYRDDSLESAQGFSPGSDILSRLISGTQQLPEIPPALLAEYLFKRRRLMEEYQPENEEELRFYFQDRRIYTKEERDELLQTLSPELPVRELMDEIFQPLPDSSLWFNRDITAQADDAEQMKNLAGEWFDWQAMVGYEQAIELWGKKTLEALVTEEQIIIRDNDCIERQVLERLLRMRRSWSRREQGQVSQAALQNQAALLNGIRMYDPEHFRPVSTPPDETGGTESGSDEMNTIDTILEKLSGTAAPIRAFIQGIFPARFGKVNEDALEGGFRRTALVWTGLGKSRIIIALDQELGLYPNSEGRQHASPDNAELETLLPSGGRYNFQQIHTRTEKTTEELQKASSQGSPWRHSGQRLLSCHAGDSGGKLECKVSGEGRQHSHAQNTPGTKASAGLAESLQHSRPLVHDSEGQRCRRPRGGHGRAQAVYLSVV